MAIWAAVTLASFLMAQGAPSPIGLAEIESAKALLAGAKGELQLQQYEVLEQELVEAEAAFQRFSALARASGEAAEVARGAEALVAAQRTSQLTKGLTALTRAGPLLVALAMLWPASTATQSQERPPKFVAKLDLEASLQRLAVHSQQMAEQMKATVPRKSVEPAKEAAGRDKDRCGTCVCMYKGFGPEGAGQMATRADCKAYCGSKKRGHRPANGMTCTGDKAVEWWN